MRDWSASGAGCLPPAADSPCSCSKLLNFSTVPKAAAHFHHLDSKFFYIGNYFLVPQIMKFSVFVRLWCHVLELDSYGTCVLQKNTSWCSVYVCLENEGNVRKHIKVAHSPKRCDTCNEDRLHQTSMPNFCPVYSHDASYWYFCILEMISRFLASMSSAAMCCWHRTAFLLQFL